MKIKTKAFFSGAFAAGTAWAISWLFDAPMPGWFVAAIWLTIETETYFEDIYKRLDKK